MIPIKTDEDIQIIREGAEILGKVHGEIARTIKPGINTLSLDKLAYQYIQDAGAKPSFKGYHGFPFTLCISINDIVVHGFPGDIILNEGDIVSVDCGVLWKGFHSDSAYTYSVGAIEPAVQKLLDTTKASLYKGIEQAVAGNRMGDLAHAIQHYNESHGFTVVRELVGHGVGKHLHEKPEVPNYGTRGKGVKLSEGMVLAIEPMINLGKRDVYQEEDGWTIRTKDGKPSAHFEHTVLVQKGQAEILTTFKYIEEALQNG